MPSIDDPTLHPSSLLSNLHMPRFVQSWNALKSLWDLLFTSVRKTATGVRQVIKSARKISNESALSFRNKKTKVGKTRTYA